MGLINLIKNLDSATKAKLLGKETTKILRYSFAENKNSTLSEDILNNAVALHDGVNLVDKDKKREDLIYYIDKNELIKKGFKDEKDIFEQAIKKYNKNKNEFYTDFDIEHEYRKIEVIDNRENYEYVKPIYGECNGKNAFPHPYQLRLKKNITEKLGGSNYDSKKILVTMPTGAGKTLLAMEIIVDILRNHYCKKPINIAWVVNSKELCEQSLQSFQKIWKQKGDRPVMAQRYFDRFNTFNEDKVDKITFASFQLLVPRINNNSFDDINFITNLDYLFIDEAHFSGADEYKKVINTYVSINKDPKIVGLTATPYRADDEKLHTLKSQFNHYLRLTNLNNIEVDNPIAYLIEKEYLSDISYEVVNTFSNDDNPFQYYKELHKSIIKVCENLILENKNTIIFAESKSHAIALSLFLKVNEIENGLIIGETLNINRKKLLKRLGDKNDSLNVIVNERILQTGIDVPGLNSIIVLTKIESPNTALQILGRAMRGPKNGGNKNNTIYVTQSNRSILENYNIIQEKVLRK
jgi:superfamily II DNA or RNA helicase